jgi:hypothetical protein
LFSGYSWLGICAESTAKTTPETFQSSDSGSRNINTGTLDIVSVVQYFSFQSVHPFVVKKKKKKNHAVLNGRGRSTEPTVVIADQREFLVQLF